MTEESRKINIVIGGRSYPVLVNPEEEVSLRNMEKEVNEKISEIQKKYDGIDKVDALSMTLLTYAFESIKQSKSQESPADMSDINEALNAAILELSE